MDILKTLQSRAQSVEVVELRSEAVKVEYEANRLKSSRVEETSGIAVRVVKDGRLGFSASSDPTAVEKLVSNALESAAYGEEIALEFPAPQPAPQVVIQDDAIIELPIAKMAEMGQEILDLILPVDPEAKINLSLERRVQNLSLRNQTGTEIAFERSPFSILAEVNSVKEDDILILFDYTGTTVWEEDYLAMARILADKLKRAQKVTTLRSGRMPVLFAPEGVLTLGLPMMEGLNGKNVYKGISPMAGKIGEKLFDEKITMIDDPTLDGKFESAPYDDEGVAHRRNVLVEGGVLKGFYYDLKTAVQAGVEPTGNGSRGLFSPPYPSTTNLVMGGGDTPVAEMISGIDYGLLVYDVLGLGQGNIISGAFSNPLSLAFMIEKGEIVGRVKNASIAGNIYEALKEVEAVSQETQWVYASLCLPYLLLPNMNVVVKE